jgi:hypothetical protein
MSKVNTFHRLTEMIEAESERKKKQDKKKQQKKLSCQEYAFINPFHNV